jgi:pimeloyl-ACP methyl ester carboxylesterase
MHVTITGTGPALLCIHGSATDADTWGYQRRELARMFRVITYDRRGTPRSPLPAGVTAHGVAEHARDAAAVIREHAGGSVIACGSSFGAVCALELLRQRPELLRGVVLCEPPLSATGTGSLAPQSYRVEFERLLRERGGRAAAEYFLRAVLGPTFDRLLPPILERCLSLHEQIILDSQALFAYQVHYSELCDVRVPVLLLRGERSQPFFGPALEALAAALPRAALRTIQGGSHMMHVDAYRAFNRELTAFAERLDHAATH